MNYKNLHGEKAKRRFKFAGFQAIDANSFLELISIQNTLYDQEMSLLISKFSVSSRGVSQSTLFFTNLRAP